jgi:maleate isomerase
VTVDAGSSPSTVVDRRKRFHAEGFGSLATQTAVGVIAPYDLALDRELWRWVPDDVSLLFTRTPYAALDVTMEMARWVSRPEAIGHSVRALSAAAPSAYVYACTSGSFGAGLAGERALCEQITFRGAAEAVTTSGALLAALAHLRAGRVAIATPYDEHVTAHLAAFLAEAGHEVARYACLDLSKDIWKVPYDATADLVRAADSADAGAIVVACTNLATYDLIAPLEAELGKPVVSANQATMWAAMLAVGRQAVGAGQRLLGDASMSPATGTDGAHAAEQRHLASPSQIRSLAP